MENEEHAANEKQEVLFQKWFSAPDIKFNTPEAEQFYRTRITRIKDAVQMRKNPDRVPIIIYPSFFPAYNAGFTPKEMMYDYEKLQKAYKKFLLEFNPDGHIGADMPGPGRFYDIIDYKLYSWPGHGVPPERSYQANEGEYMMANEYDALIEDPTSFFLHIYLPRVFGAMAPFIMLPTFTGILEMYGVAYNFIPFGLPPVQNALKALMDAGNEAVKWVEALGVWNSETAAMGYPSIWGGYTKAPFDVVGDTLRGTKGIMTDIFRQPKRLLQAMDRITPLMIKMGVGSAQMNNKPMIFIPLHKGADGFLSDEHFKRFYWPTLKQVILGLVEEGVVPFIAAEGGFNTRLDVIKDLPKGKTVWMMDQTDMERAKHTLGKVACLTGNVPSALLKLGTPKDIEEYVKKLINNASGGGGLIVGNGAFFDEVREENVKAMVETTKEFGVYK